LTIGNVSTYSGLGSVAKDFHFCSPLGALYMAKPGLGTTDQDLEQLTTLFRLLSDKTRLSILMLLCEGERNVGSLCQELVLPQPTVSHHLGLLRVNNVIGNRRAGKQVFYGMNGQVGAGETSLIINAQNYDIRISARAT
jgi:ArsR family transcriptional regulator, zinc-responsive transcriptional repressor